MEKEDIKKVVVAYKSQEGDFGGIEVFLGTVAQIAQSKNLLIESWKGMGTERVNIVYEGKSLKEAKAAIQGLESVDEEAVSFTYFSQLRN